MSQAANINMVSSSSDVTDLLSKSHVIVDAIKKEDENNNPFVGKTRRGKKNELMPTNSKVVALQEFNAKKTDSANNQKPGDDSVNGTSIYFRLALLFVNNLMQTNQLEMTAQALGLQANQKSMELIQQGFKDLNADMSKPVTQDPTKAKNWFDALWYGGAGALILGIIFVAVTVVATVLTGGLALPFFAAAGALLMAGGIGSMVTGNVAIAKDKEKPGSAPLISSLVDDLGGTDPKAIADNNRISSILSGQAQTTNNQTSGNMQNLQSINSLQQQYANMFAQMMNYYSSSMGR
jgi:hypothetical protein